VGSTDDRCTAPPPVPSDAPHPSPALTRSCKARAVAATPATEPNSTMSAGPGPRCRSARAGRRNTLSQQYRASSYVPCSSVPCSNGCRPLAISRSRHSMVRTGPPRRGWAPTQKCQLPAGSAKTCPLVTAVRAEGPPPIPQLAQVSAWHAMYALHQGNRSRSRSQAGPAGGHGCRSSSRRLVLPRTSSPPPAFGDTRASSEREPGLSAARHQQVPSYSSVLDERFTWVCSTPSARRPQSCWAA
jgi:hypothetical protein